MASLLKLDERMGPRLIRPVYVLGSLALGVGLLVGVAGGLMGFVTGLGAGSGGAMLAPLAATAAWAAGLLLAWVLLRVACELVLLAYDVRDRLERATDVKQPAA